MEENELQTISIRILEKRYPIRIPKGDEATEMEYREVEKRLGDKINTYRTEYGDLIKDPLVLLSMASADFVLENIHLHKQLSDIEQELNS